MFCYFMKGKGGAECAIRQQTLNAHILVVFNGGQGVMIGHRALRILCPGQDFIGKQTPVLGRYRFILVLVEKSFEP
jgi:hypothetical protein